MIGAVLCGGRSTRMGRDKATLEVAGRPMAQWVARAMAEAGLDPVVALGARAEVGLPVVADAAGIEGPLAALVAGLRGHESMVVCPCDVPLISAETLGRLVVAHGTTQRPATWAYSDRLEPLIGVYSVEALALLEQGWARGARGPKIALGRSDVQLVSVSAEEVRNVNTPADVAAVEGALGRR